MNNEKPSIQDWKRLYQAALLETDPQIAARLMEEAEHAIVERALALHRAGDDGNADERADAVELIETAEIVEEKLGKRRHEERHTGVADPARLLPHADEEECESEKRPGDRVRHVACKVAAERKGERRADGEIIGDLDVEEQEGQDRA